MGCPDEAALTVHASAPEEPAPGEGWSVAALTEHLAGCPACREQVERQRRAVEAFQAVDLVDAQRYDDAWLEELARQVEAGLGDGDEDSGSRPAARGDVVPLRRSRRPAPRFLTVAAVAAVLVVGLWLSGRQPDTTTDEPATASANPLAERGRQLGRSLLDEALAEDEADEGGLLASVLDTDTLLEELAEEHWSFHATIEDELDALTTDELRSLEARL